MYAYIYYGIFLSCFQTICSDNLMKSPFYKYIVTIFLFFLYIYLFIYLFTGGSWSPVLEKSSS